MAASLVLIIAVALHNCNRSEDSRQLGDRQREALLVSWGGQDPMDCCRERSVWHVAARECTLSASARIYKASMIVLLADRFAYKHTE